jgi:hypothetical protein
MAPLRLLDVNTMQFADGNYLAEKERQSKKVIPYAILSHRWLAEEDEVQFGDIKSLEVAVSKKGFAKIFQSCRLAKEQGLGFVWLDTCCIDVSCWGITSFPISDCLRNLSKDIVYIPEIISKRQ